MRSDVLFDTMYFVKMHSRTASARSTISHHGHQSNISSCTYMIRFRGRTTRRARTNLPADFAASCTTSYIYCKWPVTVQLTRLRMQIAPTGLNLQNIPQRCSGARATVVMPVNMETNRCSTSDLRGGDCEPVHIAQDFFLKSPMQMR